MWRLPAPQGLRVSIRYSAGNVMALVGWPLRAPLLCTLACIEGVLARLEEPTLQRIAQAVGNDTKGLVQKLARRKLIREGPRKGLARNRR
jgi:hypothetical protein